MIFFPLIVKAGQTIPVATRARSVYYESATGAGETIIRVVMQGGAGSEYMLKVGQGFRAGEDYEQLLVTNPGATDIAGFLVLADAGFFDNRVVGTVSISGTVGVTGNVVTIDAGHNRSAANASFIAGASVGSGSGQAFAQLWNPVGSGKNIVVSSFDLVTSPAASLAVSKTTGALSTLVAGGVQSKLLGGAVTAVAQLRMQQGGALTGRVKLFDLSAPALVRNTYKFSDPLIIMPGNGLLLEGSPDGAAGINELFDFYEE